jgi:hypothetical protein
MADLLPTDDKLLIDNLVDRYFDETIDGDRNNPEDLAVFLEPFLNTIQLQSS